MKKLTTTHKSIIVFFALETLLIFLGGLFKVLHLPMANEMLIVPMVLMFISIAIFWVVAIVQMLTNTFENKVIWLFLMFIFPFATPVIFLLTKEERIKTA
jgi:hypothetical protein